MSLVIIVIIIFVSGPLTPIQAMNPFRDAINIDVIASNFAHNISNFVANTLNFVANALGFVANASIVWNTTLKP